MFSLYLNSSQLKTRWRFAWKSAFTVRAPAAAIENAIRRHWCLVCISHSSEKGKTSGLICFCLRSPPKHLLHVCVSLFQVTEISMGEFLMHSSVVWLNPHPSLGRMRKDPEMTVFGESAAPAPLPLLLLHCGNVRFPFPTRQNRKGSWQQISWLLLLTHSFYMLFLLSTNDQKRHFYVARVRS